MAPPEVWADGLRHGSLDRWCEPNTDSTPLFDRSLEAPAGGFFAMEPFAACRVETEMHDPRDGTARGNFPQGLSHLAMVHAALILEDPEPEA